MSPLSDVDLTWVSLTAMSVSPAHLYGFGSFRVDTSKRTLLRDGKQVRLTPKVFDTLLVLLENSGRVIEKDEMMDKVWPDTVVEENNLNVNISILRKALEERPSGRQFIVTIPGRGYRFAAIVSELGDDDTDLIVESHTLTRIITEQRQGYDDEDGQPRQDNPLGSNFAIPVRSMLQLGESSSVIAVPAAASRRPIQSEGIERPRRSGSLAVLPFSLLTSNEADVYLGLGMSDALITRLSSINRIIIRPTSAIAGYDSLHRDAAEVGRELGVDKVLEGCFQRVGERIRVTVQLVSVGDGTILWADKFNEEFTDIFAVEDSISEQVAAVLTPKLSEDERKLLTKRHTESNDPHHSYLKGRYHWNKRTAAGLKKGMH